MPFITGPITKDTQPGEEIAGVHKELLALGFPIAPAEQGAKRFGASTITAVRTFRNRYGLPQSDSVDQVAGRLMHVASLSASSRDRAALRNVVKKGVAVATSTQPQELYWLARYAIMNGDYALAKVAAGKAGTFAPVRDEIKPIIDLPTPGRGRPEVPYPENFYTYQYDLVDPDLLETLRQSLEAVTPENPKPPSNGPDQGRGAALKQATGAWLRAIEQWQVGYREAQRRRFESAVAAYSRSQEATVQFFTLYHPLDAGSGSTDARLLRLFQILSTRNQQWPHLWETLRWRRTLLSLEELHAYDWGSPLGLPGTAFEFIKQFLHRAENEDPNGLRTITRQIAIESSLLRLALVIIPLARAEANGLRRQFNAAVTELKGFLDSQLNMPPQFRITCEFIELPFVRLRTAEILLEKGDAEYKARIPVDPENERDKTLLTQAAQRSEFKNLIEPSTGGNAHPPFQMLQAAITYFDLLKLYESQESGQYLSRAREGVINLNAEFVGLSNTTLETIGKNITIPTIESASSSNALPGLDSTVSPHEPFLKFRPSGNEPAMSETNPRIYAILLTAFARLKQLHAQFNWFGYRNDYVPPWRFPFLLERARYFAEHAKNAQREYLNFLSNAEREEFQELTTAQNVELEKSNVRIETARVEQARLEVVAATESVKLGKIAENNARTRYENYWEFDAEMDELEAASMFASFISGAMGVAVTSVLNPAAGGAAFVGFMADTLRSGAETGKADLQRALELRNLDLAILEAEASANLAEAQLATAAAGTAVAGLQRQAALLRHEYALQNLTFLRNRALNTEQWYRLVAGIRNVSETYLRYAMELAFLAEQAYEFEVDKRIDVIRFDYDISELGEMLAADFLLRDLDTLEQDLILGQRLRQQQVRYVLSLGREFPATLQELRDNGSMTFSLRLEQLERRFPGLYNLRISSVEILSVALMDPTRFSLQLTHLGSAQVRLKAKPDTLPGTPSLSPLNTNDLDIKKDDWLRGLREQWPVKVRVTGRETAVFSGLTRQDQVALSTFFTANQRGAFEGIGGASAWEVDMSMKENRVVPGTLADVLITFTLCGYYDSSLRETIDAAPRKARSTTTWFSAHRSFPDAFFQFNRSGRMDWDITPGLLNLNGSPDAVRNVSLLLQPAANRPALGRLFCSYPVEFEVTAGGQLKVITALPRVTLAVDGLTLRGQANFAPDTVATWYFGDGTDSSGLPHTYSRSGRYEVMLRLATGGRLFEYRAAVVVSRTHTIVAPLIIVPQMSITVEQGKLELRPSLNQPTGESLSVRWHVDNKGPDEGDGPVMFTIEPGRHVLHFAAVRPLKGRFYSKQRYLPNETISLAGIHLATNRTFEVGTDEETTTNRNSFTQHLFGANQAPLPLSPIDRWTFELPLADNPAAIVVSSNDALQFDLSEISDALFTLEYAVSDV